MVYVNQNPWTFFDPLGLSRTDPAGFEWKGTGHRKVPVEVAADAGWHPDAKEVFDAETIPTPNGHNNVKHGRRTGYNAEVAAEMAEFLQEKGGLGGKTAREQQELAREFVRNRIDKGNNQFIEGFNKAVEDGPAGIQKWFDESGKKIVMKSTGKTAATRGAKIINGIAKVAEKGGKILRVPVVGGTLIIGAGVLQGKSNEEIGRDVIMSASGGDIAKWILEENPVTRAGTRMIEKRNQEIEDILEEFGL